MDQQQDSLFELQIDHQSTDFLRETAKWSKFLAIVGFVFIGLFLLGMAFWGTILGAGVDAAYGSGGALGALPMLVMIPFVLIYFFPTLFLYRFATRMQVALRNTDQEMLNRSFESLKSCFKFIGILMIIGLSFYLLALFIGIAVGSRF